MAEFTFVLTRRVEYSCQITIDADDFNAAHDIAWGEVPSIDWNHRGINERLIMQSVIPLGHPFPYGELREHGADAGSEDCPSAA